MLHACRGTKFETDSLKGPALQYVKRAGCWRRPSAALAEPSERMQCFKHEATGGVCTPDGIPGEGLGVSGQTGCVPAIVSGKLTAQVVGGDTLAEGTCMSKSAFSVAAADG